MRGKWELRDWEMESWKHCFRLYIEALERGTENIDLSDKDLNPYQAYQVLENLGWIRMETDCDVGRQETWVFYRHPNHDKELVVFSCGMTFELKIYLLREE